ncbi:MAG: hypothetical protein JWO02_324 [Solirubrobacterales bacterium]|nr:hypothetical protein [Solirubrobacterales bacterium]
MTDRRDHPKPDCGSGICAGDVPPLIGRILTGTGLTLDQAAARVLANEALPAELTEIQRRLVHEHALHL